MKILLSKDESGFILIISMVILLVLTLLGVWGVQTGTFELSIAGNQQRFDENFNNAEGGANLEATRVGFSSKSNYQISDPESFNQILSQPASSSPTIESDKPSTWSSSDDLIGTNGADSKTTYNYLVMYRFPDAPPKGYDVSHFSGYKFRINGLKNVIVELGGIKVGVKASYK